MRHLFHILSVPFFLVAALLGISLIFSEADSYPFSLSGIINWIPVAIFLSIGIGIWEFGERKKKKDE